MVWAEDATAPAPRAAKTAAVRARRCLGMATILRVRPARVIRRATDPHPWCGSPHPDTDGCLSTGVRAVLEVRGSRSGTAPDAVPAALLEAGGMQIRLLHVALVGVLALTVTGVANGHDPGQHRPASTPACYAQRQRRDARDRLRGQGPHLHGEREADGLARDRPQGRDRPAGPRRPEGRDRSAGAGRDRPSPAATSAPAANDVGTATTRRSPRSICPRACTPLAGKASIYQRRDARWRASWAMVSCRLLQKSPRRGRDRARHHAHRGQRRLQRARVR